MNHLKHQNYKNEHPEMKYSSHIQKKISLTEDKK